MTQVGQKREGKRLFTPHNSSKGRTEGQFTPFHHNYTIKGLIDHIQSGLSEVISSRQTQKNDQKDGGDCQLQVLLKIQEQVAVLKNIIIYNLSQILANMYPQSGKSKEEQQVNRSYESKKNDPFSESFIITDFQEDCEHEAYGKINHLQVHKERAIYYNSICQKQTPMTDVGKVNSHQSSEAAPLKTVESKEITPFQLTESFSMSNIRIQDQKEDGEEQGQDGLDLLCYEDQKSIAGFRSARLMHKEEKDFSPIVQRAAEQQQTAQKVFKDEMVVTFNKEPTPSCSVKPLTQLSHRSNCYQHFTHRRHRPSGKKYQYLLPDQQRRPLCGLNK